MVDPVKPEKLILRVEGRTPNDEAATFKIKFAGSFVAAADVKSDEPPLPEVTSSNQTDVRVNSVGTIIEVKPKPVPTPKEIIAEAKKSERETKRRSEEKTTADEAAAETKVLKGVDAVAVAMLEPGVGPNIQAP